MRQIILCDIDDNLYSFKEIFAAKAEQLLGFDVRLNTHDTWDCLFKVFPCPGDFNEALRACFTPATIAANKPYANAAKVLTRLAKDFEIWYVSDRPDTAAVATRKWLKENGFPTPGQLVCTVDKRGWMEKHQHRLATIIDDRPRTLTYALMELDIDEVFALRHAWNSDLTDVTGVNIAPSWLALGEMLDSWVASYKINPAARVSA